MRTFLFGLAEVTLSMSAVIALLFLGGRAWSRHFAPRWRYLAWLVVAVRLAVPLNLSLPKAPVTVAVPAAVVQAAPETGTVPLPEGFVPYTPDGKAGGQWPPLQSVLFGVWAAGAAAFLAVQWGGYAAARRKVRRWGRETGEYEGLKVVECAKVDSPMLVGFLRPVIVLPEGIEGAARDFALLHEATHHRRHDLWYKFLLVWCNAIHWFNPLAWVLRREAAGDVELACDEALLRGRDEDYRRSYGAALVSQAAGRTPGAALTSAFSGSRGSLKARVLALLDMAPKRSGRMALAAVCILSLMAGTLVACQSAEETRNVVIYRMEVPEDDWDKPATSISFLDVDYYDSAAGAGYYYSVGPEVSEALTKLPVAEDAPYTGFPTSLNNSRTEDHPSKVLWMSMLLSSLLNPGIPAQLTIRDGVIVDLSPLENCVRIPIGSEGVVAEDGVHYEEKGNGVISRVMPETNYIHGYWCNEDGAMDYGRPFSLQCADSDLMIRLSGGERLSLEALELHLMFLSSLGPVMEIQRTDGVVTSIEQTDVAYAAPVGTPEKRTDAPTQTAGQTVWTCSGTYDDAARTLTFTPVEVDEKAGTYRDTGAQLVTMEVAEGFAFTYSLPNLAEGNTLTLPSLKEAFANQPKEGGGKESLLKLSVEDGVIVDGWWAAAYQPAE